MSHDFVFIWIFKIIVLYEKENLKVILTTLFNIDDPKSKCDIHFSQIFENET